MPDGPHVGSMNLTIRVVQWNGQKKSHLKRHTLGIDESHKSQNALSHIPQFIIQNRNVHISIYSERCIVEYGMGALWDL